MKQMKDKCFFDTNLLIYLYSSDEPTKKDKITQLVNSIENPFISTQVICEISNVLWRKKSLNWSYVKQVIDELEKAFIIKKVLLQDIYKAYEIADKYKYSFFDSLILASSIKLNCKVLYSEDFQHEQIIDRELKIINPFKA